MCVLTRGLAWQPPERKPVHGNFLGYRLSFHPRDVDETKATIVPMEAWGELLTAEHVKKTCASAWKRIDLMIKARGHTFEPGKKKN